MATPERTTALHASLRDAQLVPGSASPLIGEGFTPTTTLSVAFGSKGVELGNLLRAGDCKPPPAISFALEKDHEDAKYVLILTDPDAPTPDDPKFAFWRHWVVTDLRPSPDSSTGRDLTAYLGPGPKDDSKPHRYLFMLYRTPHGWQPTKADVGGEEFVERRSFKAAEFVEANALILVGFNWMMCAGDGWQGDANSVDYR